MTRACSAWTAYRADQKAPCCHAEISDIVAREVGINALMRIGENLQKAGLTYDDVVSMRVFLQNAEGQAKMDCAGWNRAYRQFFANTNLATGTTMDVQLGSTTTKPMVVNDARPSRFALEIENLPVNGWLVEVEVDAVYPQQ